MFESPLRPGSECWVAQRFHFGDFQHGFSLVLWHTGLYDTRGGERLGYRLRCVRARTGYTHKTPPVFRGGDTLFLEENFTCSPLHNGDHPNTLAALLDFLSRRPNDSEAYVFESYTDQQLRFAELYGEQLSCEAYLLRVTDDPDN